LAAAYGTRLFENEDLNWDAYLLYSADAQWGDLPPATVSFGRTIVQQRERLRSDLLSLLKK
jgi:hypothetical protein